MKRVGMRSRRGIALLLVISLLALVTLLVVSLAVLTRVETQTSIGEADRAQARQNALMALNIAIGQLQKYAGPDARVTASAEMFTRGDLANVRNPFWTGVWSSADKRVSPLTWLVSGNENSEDSVPELRPDQDLERNLEPNSASLVTLVSSRIAGQNGAVSVRKVSISAGGKIAGRMAWWVADESLKLKPNSADRLSLLSGNLDESDTQLAGQLSAQSQDIDAVVKGFEPSGTPLATVINYPGFAVSGTAGDFTDAFHRTTASAFGLLASTGSSDDAGLRRDLSVSPELLSEGFANWIHFGALGRMDFPSEKKQTRVYTIQPGTGAAPGDVIDSIAPVLSDFGIGVFIFSPTATSQNLTVRVQVFAELWNPYSSELAIKPLRIRIHGLPVLTVTCSNGDEVALDIDALLGPNPMIELPDLDSDLFRFLPGRVLRWTGVGGRDSSGLWHATPNGATGSTGQFEQTGAIVLPNAVPANSKLSVKTTDQPQLTIELLDSDGATTISTSLGPKFEQVQKADYAINKVTESGLAFRFRLLDRVDYSLGSPSEWFMEYDVRSSEMPASRFIIDQLQAGQAVSPGSFRMTITGPTGSFLDRSASTKAGAPSLQTRNDVVLFELPRAPVTSIGSLQNVGFAGARPFAFCNSWMSETGIGADIVDRFYFSGLAEPTDSLDALPIVLWNTTLAPKSIEPGTTPTNAEFVASAGARTSQFVMIDGPLNVNTASEDVWAAAIGGRDFPQWMAVNISSDWGAQSAVAGEESEDVELENAIFRFPQSAPETYQLDQNLTVFDQAERLFYRRGVVQLSNEERDALASKIVERIQAKLQLSGPFRTLGEFFSAGILESAIDDLANTPNSTLRLSSRLGIPDWAEAELDQNSPSYLTQADLLGGIAPRLTARGDTFKVRVYGEALNDSTGASTAECWIEAVVQRIPDFVEPSNQSTDSFSELTDVNKRFGRRFRILQFRWLDDSSI